MNVELVKFITPKKTLNYNINNVNIKKSFMKTPFTQQHTKKKRAVVWKMSNPNIKRAEYTQYLL